MLKETIYSSLFTLASKRNRVRVGYENVGFVRGCCFKQLATPLLEPNLVAPIFHQPDVSYSHWWEARRNHYFFCVLFRKKRVISQCLLLMQYVKNPLSGARSARELPGTRSVQEHNALLPPKKPRYCLPYCAFILLI